MPTRSRARLAFCASLFVLLLAGVQPASFAQAVSDAWTPFSPGSLELPSLATTPEAPGTLYLASSSQEGLYRSTDGGHTWSSARGLERVFAWVPVADPFRPEVLYTVGAGDQSSSANLFISTDGGTNWQQGSRIAEGGGPGFPRSSLVIGGRDTLYVSFGNGLLASFDRGETWALIYEPQDALIQSIAADVSAPGTVYLATARHIRKTENGGLTWKDIGGDVIAPVGQNTISLSVAPTQPPAVYAGVFGQGIFRSTDGGASWRRLSVGDGSQALPFTALTVSTANPTTIYTAYKGSSRDGFTHPAHVAVSTDAGDTWQIRDLGLTLRSVQELTVDPSTGALYAESSLGSLQVSRAGKPWRSLIQSPFEAGAKVSAFSVPVAKVRFRPEDPSTVYTLAYNQQWKSVDGGATWTALGRNSPFLEDLAFDPADSGVLYGASEKGVYRSIDQGAVWTPLGGPEADTVLLPRPGTILAGGCGISQSTDGGATWREVLSCQPQGHALRRLVRRMIAKPADSNIVYAQMVDGTVHQIYKSQDGGATWSLLVGADALAFDPIHPRTLYASRGNDLIKSTDEGRTWQAISSVGTPLRDLVIDPASPTTFYALASTGKLLRSRDSGRTWGTAGPAFSSVLPVSPVALVLHPTVPHLLYVELFFTIYEVRLDP